MEERREEGERRRGKVREELIAKVTYEVKCRESLQYIFRRGVRSYIPAIRMEPQNGGVSSPYWFQSVIMRLAAR